MEFPKEIGEKCIKKFITDFNNAMDNNVQIGELSKNQYQWAFSQYDLNIPSKWNVPKAYIRFNFDTKETPKLIAKIEYITNIAEPIEKKIKNNLHADKDYDAFTIPVIDKNSTSQDKQEYLNVINNASEKIDKFLNYWKQARELKEEKPKIDEIISSAKLISNNQEITYNAPGMHSSPDIKRDYATIWNIIIDGRECRIYKLSKANKFICYIKKLDGKHLIAITDYDDSDMQFNTQKEAVEGLIKAVQKLKNENR